MANTYHQIYIHTVFAVKFRNALIEKSWNESLFSVIANLVKETGCKPIIVNGLSDHVHCFFELKPSVAISDVMKNAIAKSYKWINESGFFRTTFAWQEGFGAFSCNHNEVRSIYKYILNQDLQHHNQTFEEEYEQLLKDHGIKYENIYVFQKPI